MDYIILGVDSLIVAGLYYIYRHKKNIISNVESAPQLDLSTISASELPSATLEYCMIQGTVKPDSLELSSQFKEGTKGVVRLLEIVEHGTKWHSNIALDTNRLITRVINNTPFSLASPNFSIRVEQPLEAEYLLDSMDVIYKTFDPSQQSVLARILSDLTFNETVRGIETTEKMLRTGANVIAFGKLERLSSESLKTGADAGKMLFRLGEPTLKGDYSYIITTMSRSALLSRLKDTTRTLKIILAIFGLTGCAIGAYCAYRSYWRVKQWYERQRVAREIAKARQERAENERRQRRERQTTGQNSNNEHQSENTSCCVICLTNPRELVLLDCGHVCLCMDCFEQLPNPNCPVCRQPYRTFAPCYLP